MKKFPTPLAKKKIMLQWKQEHDTQVLKKKEISVHNYVNKDHFK